MAAAVDRERSKFQTPPTYRATMRVLWPTYICSNFFSVTGRKLNLSIQSSSTIEATSEWSFTFTLVYAFMIYRGINLNCPYLSSLDLRLFQRWVTEVTEFHFSHEFVYCYSFLSFFIYIYSSGSSWYETSLKYWRCWLIFFFFLSFPQFLQANAAIILKGHDCVFPNYFQLSCTNRTTGQYIIWDLDGVINHKQ